MATYVATVRVISDGTPAEIRYQLRAALKSAAAASQLTGMRGYAVLEVVEEAPRKTYHVEINMTGERASRDFPDERTASSACRTLNLDAGPGGKYGVYDNQGNRS